MACCSHGRSNKVQFEHVFQRGEQGRVKPWMESEGTLGGEWRGLRSASPCVHNQRVSGSSDGQRLRFSLSCFVVFLRFLLCRDFSFFLFCSLFLFFLFLLFTPFFASLLSFLPLNLFLSILPRSFFFFNFPLILFRFILHLYDLSLALKPFYSFLFSVFSYLHYSFFPILPSTSIHNFHVFYSSFIIFSFILISSFLLVFVLHLSL